MVNITCSISEQTLQANIGAALERGLPPVFGKLVMPRKVVVCAGGPSLGLFTSASVPVIGLNGAASRVKADFMVAYDPLPQNASFFGGNHIHLLGSRMAPEAFDACKGPAYLWHVYDQPEMDRKLEPLVGGGPSVGLKAIVLLYMLGAREFHLFGYDSCYVDDKHHAYEQPWDDGREAYEAVVNGRTFLCEPWMVAQAEQFMEMVPQLEAQFHVYGDGLIAELCKPGKSKGTSGPKQTEKLLEQSRQRSLTCAVRSAFAGGP